MREAMDDLSERMGCLEEEGDFDRELLDNPARRGELGPGNRRSTDDT